MKQGFWHRLKQCVLILAAFAAAAGWLYVIYSEKRANDPIEIVKKHFVFYPEYSHGVWKESQCANKDGERCREVRYTVPVKDCGPVTFDWNVFTGDEADSTSWSYNGPSPRFDENKYPLYAVLSGDSRLIDSPALGKPLPQVCHAK